MPALTLVSVNRGSGRPASAGLVHDMRNVVATVGLHLETLERLAGPQGGKAASAAHALILKAGVMCGEALQEAHRADGSHRRSKVDVVKIIRRVMDMTGPIAPEGLSMCLHADATLMAVGNAEEIFRILFNLAHNAVMVARRTARMSKIEFLVERSAATIAVRISDDGPGLPEAVRSSLFGRPAGGLAIGSGGHGLAIARELAEYNGGTLQLSPSLTGTTFTLVLGAVPRSAVQEGPVTRLLG